MAKLQIVDEISGEVVYTFTNTGFFGMIENDMLTDIYTGLLDKSEIKVSCFLMSTATWSNMVDNNITKGAKATGMSYKAYAEVIKRLITKKVIFESKEELFFNPAKFRRKSIKFKKKPNPLNPNKAWEQIQNDGH